MSRKGVYCLREIGVSGVPAASIVQELCVQQAHRYRSILVVLRTHQHVGSSSNIERFEDFWSIDAAVWVECRGFVEMMNQESSF